MTGRLWAAVALCIVALGLVWSTSPGNLTPGHVGPNYCDSDGYCTPGSYTPGGYVPGRTEFVSQSPIRIFLIAAALALVYVATRTGASAHRFTRAAIGCLGVAGVLAAAHRATLPLVCVAVALALVVSLGRPS